MSVEIFFQISIFNYTNLIPQLISYANNANLSHLVVKLAQKDF